MMKGMEQEVERELDDAERTNSGGVEHQSRAERDGTNDRANDDDGA